MRRIHETDSKQLIGLLVAISIMAKHLAREIANKKEVNYGQAIANL